MVKTDLRRHHRKVQAVPRQEGMVLKNAAGKQEMRRNGPLATFLPRLGLGGPSSVKKTSGTKMFVPATIHATDDNAQVKKPLDFPACPLLLTRTTTSSTSTTATTTTTTSTNGPYVEEETTSTRTRMAPISPSDIEYVDNKIPVKHLESYFTTTDEKGEKPLAIVEFATKNPTETTTTTWVVSPSLDADDADDASVPQLVSGDVNKNNDDEVSLASAGSHVTSWSAMPCEFVMGASFSISTVTPSRHSHPTETTDQLESSWEYLNAGEGEDSPNSALSIHDLPLTLYAKDGVDDDDEDENENDDESASSFSAGTTSTVGPQVASSSCNNNQQKTTRRMTLSSDDGMTECLLDFPDGAMSKCWQDEGGEVPEGA